MTQIFDRLSIQKRILITKNRRRQEPGLNNKTFLNNRNTREKVFIKS